MNSYRLSDKVDKNKMFLVKKSQIEKRLDPFYYIPEIVELENKVLLKRPQKLIHYVKYISSGATPKTTEIEKYYSDKKNGIPFLRVQNITEEGILLHNCKYINPETHNGLLKRSQVKEGNLIVTITGRIASASVAPIGFDGNINQHSVVLQTEGFKVSQILAAFLNSTIGQKLAWRRVTGGTRPALDYPALLSIPVIYDKQILEITKEAVKKKQTKEKQAKNLLTSIDEYLLGELGITLPKQNKSLESRMYSVTFSKVIGNRFDSIYYSKENRNYIIALEESNYPLQKLKKIADFQPGYAFKS